MGALRLFLALVVVSSHVRNDMLAPLELQMPWWATLGANGGYAVLEFYIISGFLISTALAKKYPPGRAGLRAFYAGRVVRIFSLYWPIAVLCLIALPGAWRRFAAAPLGHQISEVFLFGIDWNVLFALTRPAGQWTATIEGLEPSWSLGAELAFYAMAPFLLRSRLLPVIVLLASLAVRVAAYAAFGPGSLYNYCFLPATLAFFMLGHFARLIAARYRRLASPAAAAIASTVWLAMTLWQPIAPWDGPRFWLTFVSFALMLPGLFALTARSTVLNRIGELSYPVYLLHPMVLMTLMRWDVAAQFAALPWSISGTALFAAMCALVLAMAIPAHIVFELGFGRVLRLALKPRGVRRSCSPPAQGAPVPVAPAH
jgi:peptidoglycan/LPS O-acetylase OafA/YrhL